MTVMEHQCQACGRKGTRGYVRSAFKAVDSPTRTMGWVCRSGPACDKRCRKQGWTIYG